MSLVKGTTKSLSSWSYKVCFIIESEFTVKIQQKSKPVLFLCELFSQDSIYKDMRIDPDSEVKTFICSALGSYHPVFLKLHFP